MKKIKLLIHAPNINSGGGLELLKQFISGIDFEYELNIDSRAFNFFKSKNQKINSIRPNIFSRFMAEFKLLRKSGNYSHIICFGNIPPIFKLKTNVILFFQNKLLLEDKYFNDYPIKVSFRLYVEKFIFYYFNKNINKLIVQTDHMKETILNKLKNITDISVYPFFDFSNQIIPSKKEFDFVYIASGDSHKNHKKLIEAWINLSYDNFYPTLALTIDVNKYKSLVAWINKQKIKYQLNIINLYWLKNKDELIEAYSKSNFLIYPSKVESFAIPLIEANYYKLPIIASELDFVREVCKPIETFNPNSSLSISRAVKRSMNITEKEFVVKSSKEFVNEFIKNFN